jgi:hypothetical protein
MQTVTMTCGKPEIDLKLISKIYERLNNRNYVIRHYTPERADTYWFNVHTAALYFKLLPMTESQREYALSRIDFLINSGLLIEKQGLDIIPYVFNRAYMPGHNIRNELCLAKALFLSSGFKTSELLTYAASILQDYNSTVSSGCLGRIFQQVFNDIKIRIKN